MRRRALPDDKFFGVAVFLASHVFSELEREWDFIVEHILGDEVIRNALKDEIKAFHNDFLFHVSHPTALVDYDSEYVYKEQQLKVFQAYLIPSGYSLLH
jgi:hypothetical protein